MKGKSPMESACEYLGLNFSELKEYYKEQQIMSTKKTFKIKLDTEFTIDFGNWGFTDAQMLNESQLKRMIISEYLDVCGFDEFDVSGLKNQPISLFETIADMFCPNKK